MIHLPSPGRIPCRLCGAPSVFAFNKLLRKVYTVGYFECTECGSLETEIPYWLEETYADIDKSMDVGRIQRNLIMATLCAHILEKLSIKTEENCLDWGGAEGIFCRLMRDRGFNFCVLDKYEEPLYCQPHYVVSVEGLKPAVATAFEVFEHLPDPAAELAHLFSTRARLVLASTDLYEGQDANWWYLAPLGGQHVFFYSAAAMKWLSTRFGYRYFNLPNLHAFVDAQVWETPELEGFRTAWESIVAARETLYPDSCKSLLGHLVSENPWRYVLADSLALNKARNEQRP